MGKYPVSFTDRTRKNIYTLKVGTSWSVDELCKELEPYFGKVNAIYFDGNRVSDVRKLVLASISLRPFPVVV